MEYTILQLAQLASLTTRTLRYYDEIGLLKPKKIKTSGYRIYGEEQVDRLQQILFYRELGVELGTICSILDDPLYDQGKALEEHKTKLLKKRAQLDTILENVERTLSDLKGIRTMKDEEKFKGFTKQLIDENELNFGEELQEKYSKETLEQTNAKLMNMTSDEYKTFETLSKTILDTLLQAVETKDPSSDEAQLVARLHKEWLTFTWPNYSKEAHANLAQMYVDDPRFNTYYLGHAEFLRDAILICTSTT